VPFEKESSNKVGNLSGAFVLTTNYVNPADNPSSVTSQPSSGFYETRRLDAPYTRCQVGQSESLLVEAATSEDAALACIAAFRSAPKSPRYLITGALETATALFQGSAVQHDLRSLRSGERVLVVRGVGQPLDNARPDSRSRSDVFTMHQRGWVNWIRMSSGPRK
jgi:hypothetical protein